MELINIKESELKDYIYEAVDKSKVLKEDVINARYHHNVLYKDAISICKHGILTLNELNRRGIRNDSRNILINMDEDESHVNGNEGISLAVTGLTDLYKGEEEYDPTSPYYVDFLISNNIRTSRTSINYGNEFLCYDNIKKEDLRAIDIRLLKLVKYELKNMNEEGIKLIIDNYNCLINIALELKKQRLNIPLREMSNDKESYNLSINKLSKKPKIIIK